MLSGTLSDTVTYSAHLVAIPAIAQTKEETKEEQIYRTAHEHKIPGKHLYNLAYSESNVGLKRSGDHGKSCGIIHFHSDYYPYENSRCDDDEYILNRAAEMIASGEGWKFTPGNCYSFAKVLLREQGVQIPKMADIVPNTPYPVVGGLTIFDYNGKEHVAVNKEVRADGILVRECNYEAYLCGERLVKWSDPAMVGQWRMPDIASSAN